MEITSTSIASKGGVYIIFAIIASSAFMPILSAALGAFFITSVIENKKMKNAKLDGTMFIKMTAIEKVTYVTLGTFISFCTITILSHYVIDAEIVNASAGIAGTLSPIAIDIISEKEKAKDIILGLARKFLGVK